jgi:putative peptide zinc metalloprotease protein
VWPLAKHIGYLFTSESLAGRRARAVSAAAAALAAVLAGLGAVPAPYRTLAQGVVFTPEESWVRAAVSGVVAEVLVPSGEPVAAGTALMRLEDPVLVARVQMLEAQLEEIGARYDAALATDRVAAATLRAELALAQERLAVAVGQEAELLVRSPADGVVLLPSIARDLPGTFVQRGAALAYVNHPSRVTVRVVVPQENVDLVRQRTTGVAVRLAESHERPVTARVVRELPAATADLPSGALSVAGGGGFATDPRAGNSQTAFQSLFQFDLELADDAAATQRLGGRAYVRFDHGFAPLASQWYRQLRQLLLERLDV